MIFHLRMAWRGLRRSPGLDLVMIGALALGIGTWYAQQRTFAFLASRTPTAPDHVYLVALERGDPVPGARPGEIAPLLPSILLTPGDARAVLAGAPGRATMTFGAPGLLEPAGLAAETVRVRYATRDLFGLFDLPIVEGGAWPADADREPTAAAAPAVLDEQLARRMFGRRPAVGRRLRLDGADVEVIGVVAAGRSGRYHLYERFVPGPDAIYLPVAQAAAARAEPDFEYAIAGGETGSVTVWVELPDAAARAHLVAAAEVHLAGERARGRVAAPRAVTLRPASTWRRMFVPGGTIALWPVLAAMCLVACVVNLIRMLMVKFGGRRHELGLLRAFGARRRAVMAQLLLESVLIGLIAALAGLAVGLLVMPIASAAVPPVAGTPTAISAGAALATLAVSVGAALVAALYPAWRLSRGTPSAQLRGR